MASVYPLVKLMTAPDPAATVLFDFNADDLGTPPQRCGVEHDDFSVGSPSLQGDPDSIFPQYGPRSIDFTARFTGSKAYALGKVSAASQWLLRDRNWLMVQLDAAKRPVWFKLYRPQLGELSFGHVTKTDARDVWQWKVSLPAEPFAYGARETIGPFRIENNPTPTTAVWDLYGVGTTVTDLGSGVFRASKSSAGSPAGMSNALSTTYPAGTSVTISCEARTPSSGTAINSFYFIARDDPNNDSALYTGSGSVGAPLTLPRDDQWHPYSVTFTVPTGRNLTRAYLVADGPTIPSGQYAEFRNIKIGNPCSYVMPTILGDAAAEVRISAAFGASPIDQHDVLWNITAVNGASVFPVVWPIGTSDPWTAGTDTGAPATGAAYSGGSYRRVSFATSSALVTRLNGFSPVIAYPGRYTIYLRCARTDTSSTFSFRLGRGRIGGAYVFGGSPTVVMDRATSTSVGHATYVRLGDFSLPEGAAVGSSVGFTPFSDMGLQVARLSGTGQLDLDCFVLVPSDILSPFGMGSDTMISEFPDYGPPTNDQASVWDGDEEFYTRVNAFAVTDARVQTGIRGRFPRVRPGVTNVLHLLTQVRAGSGTIAGTTDSSDSITTATSVTVSYYPRWLFIGDGT